MADTARTAGDRGGHGGYAAYSYLVAGEDFRRFELAPEFGRVPGYESGLSAGQEQRAARLLADSLVISAWRTRPRTSRPSAAGSSSTASTTRRSGPSSAAMSTARCRRSGSARPAGLRGHGRSPREDGPASVSTRV